MPETTPSLPPSPLPPAKDDSITDVITSVKHVTDIPCARNSLLGGIAGGVGIGVVRGISSRPIIAGNWAIATFAVISLGSFHLCQRQMVNERNKVTKIIESIPRQVVKQESDES